MFSQQVPGKDGLDDSQQGHVDPYKSLGLDNQLPAKEDEYGTSAESDPMNPSAKNDGSSEQR